MTTASDLCNEALTIAGIVGDGQTPSGMVIKATFNRLNRMLAQWQRKRWLIWHLVETTLTSTGANSYTVGTGGDFNMTRPDRIEYAFFRQIVASQPNQIDYPLEEMKSYEDWARVALKTLKSFPSYYFYDSAMPLGRFYAYPVAQASIYELHILTKEVLAQFATINAATTTPPEYESAIIFNLARITRAAFRKPADPEINALARENLNVIRMANAQVPRLTMPQDLTRPGLYNIFSDQVR